MGTRVTDDRAIAEPDRGQAAWWMAWIRPKGNIEPGVLALLIALSCLPIVMALARVLALPGADAPAFLGLQHLHEIGRFLNRALTLQWVPPADRPQILYLLLLPTGALLVALARLTFGLRVLGLRAILLAIAFQEIGIAPSLALMAVVIGTVITVRPSMRRIRLPLYARVTVILCIAAAIMVAALLLAPWLRSEAVWSVAFFPVIIMAMLAEGIARTLAADDAIQAIWRLVWTIALALLIALVGQLTAIGELALRFPELILTQLCAIVFVSEFLDLRLLESWPARLSRLYGGASPWYPDRPRIAIVRNRWSTGVIGRVGPAAPRRYRKRSVQPAVDALRARGFEVRVIEGDIELLRELKSFMPPEPRTGAPGGIVLNLATGAQGDGRFCQVPAMLELAGVAYTGPDPVAHAHLQDRYALKVLLQAAGVAVGRYALHTDADASATLRFPVAVSPRCQPDAARRIAGDADALARATAEVVAAHGGDALLEEWHTGREFQVALIGNERIECLPVLECSTRGSRKQAPAAIDAALGARIRDCALRAYRASSCRDYARVDIRLGADGEPLVADVSWADLLAHRGAFARAAEAAGYGYAELLRRIVGAAASRYRTGSVRPHAHAAGESAVIALTGHGGRAKKQRAG